MGVKGVAFGLVWGELRKHILPNVRDIATAVILTLVFGIACHFSILGIVLFFILALALVYAISRLARFVKIILYVRSMKKKVEGALKPLETLSGIFKK
jgi:hypothetical protein